MPELAEKCQDLSWLLTDMAKRTPGTRGVLLLSSDGLVKAAHNLDTDAAEHMAALSSGLHSLARAAGRKLASGDEVRHIAVEVDGARLFITPAGNGTCLAVLASTNTDTAMLAFEMAQLVMGVRPYLATPNRRAAC